MSINIPALLRAIFVQKENKKTHAMVHPHTNNTSSPCKASRHTVQTVLLYCENLNDTRTELMLNTFARLHNIKSITYRQEGMMYKSLGGYTHCIGNVPIKGHSINNRKV